jgi:molybdenum cofactor biosynthesis enzyme MoaA
VDEIVSLSVQHLERAPEAMVSFGQGCEGEPLTEHLLIAESIGEIRRHTRRGTINLNTNGSLPKRLERVARSGLDCVRISLSSARPKFYNAYYRPRGYGFDDVVGSIRIAVERGLYTMINYLVFPGVTDQPSELEALMALISETGVNFVHLKNLCIDPKVYLDAMPKTREPPLGIRHVARLLKEEFPSIELGYFNRPR